MKRKGFTLLELVVSSITIFVIVVAVLGFFVSSYAFTKQSKYKAIGNNLALLTMEDVNSLSVSTIDALIHNGIQYPQLIYSEPTYPAKINNPPPPSSPFYFNYGTSWDNVYDSIRYDGTRYYLMDGSYSVERIANVLGVASDVGSASNPPPVPQLPSDFVVPPNVSITPVLVVDYDTNTSYYEWKISIMKEVYPRYFKRVILIDRTPNITDLRQKIYDATVIIYWQMANGKMNSISYSGRISYARSSP